MLHIQKIRLHIVFYITFCLFLQVAPAVFLLKHSGMSLQLLTDGVVNPMRGFSSLV